MIPTEDKVYKLIPAQREAILRTLQTVRAIVESRQGKGASHAYNDLMDDTIMHLDHAIRLLLL